jgi:hypothetical protein
MIYTSISIELPLWLLKCLIKLKKLFYGWGLMKLREESAWLPGVMYRGLPIRGGGARCLRSETARSGPVPQVVLAASHGQFSVVVCSDDSG